MKLVSCGVEGQQSSGSQLPFLPGPVANKWLCKKGKLGRNEHYKRLSTNACSTGPAMRHTTSCSRSPRSPGCWRSMWNDAGQTQKQWTCHSAQLLADCGRCRRESGSLRNAELAGKEKQRQTKTTQTTKPKLWTPRKRVTDLVQLAFFEPKSRPHG